jgi:hypothetical protein
MLRCVIKHRESFTYGVSHDTYRSSIMAEEGFLSQESKLPYVKTEIEIFPGRRLTKLKKKGQSRIVVVFISIRKAGHSMFAKT